MALSQKHSGKILVPWYNSHEWRYVYSLIYSKDSSTSDKERGLEILEVWKIRMPILFAGLEGTLIILKAMLQDENKFSKEELSSFYGLSIMRFLNLCAAHSDQQGTFFRVAKERNLPEWLVNIRHDLAHSQKQLSLFMLRKGIEYCFQWLKREYWEPQDRKIKDFVIPDVVIDDIEEKLKLFFKYVIATINREKLSPAISKMLKQLKANKNSNLSEILRKMLKNSKSAIEKIPGLIIENGCLFVMPFEEDINQISRSYVEGWEPLIQYLLENNVLIELIKKFHDIFNNNDDCKIQKLSSLWLSEIFKGLLNGKGMSDTFMSETEDFENSSTYVMNLNYPSEKFVSELRIFADEAIETPHIYFRNYFSSLMTLCNYHKDFIRHVDNLLIEYFYPHETLAAIDKIPMSLENINEIIGSNIFETLSPSEQTVENSNRRWIKIEDTDIYEGCPIGILPHQCRNINPTISF